MTITLSPPQYLTFLPFAHVKIGLDSALGVGKNFSNCNCRSSAEASAEGEAAVPSAAAVGGGAFGS